ncbi:PREDICTED: uncharacterized protein LOC105449760 [Wasmannia auropunctata]|uniref:uncharacterized protein LOC105449760 n=1 Tax=Wasmannia auropunctata TaxID=64793 RepID=UPI0005EE4615|nr:PREDICTED: uncharacterized protein LOC105449760 [Wasmannia auropunctata]
MQLDEKQNDAVCTDKSTNKITEINRQSIKREITDKENTQKYQNDTQQITDEKNIQNDWESEREDINEKETVTLTRHNETVASVDLAIDDSEIDITKIKDEYLKTKDKLIKSLLFLQIILQKDARNYQNDTQNVIDKKNIQNDSNTEREEINEINYKKEAVPSKEHNETVVSADLETYIATEIDYERGIIKMKYGDLMQASIKLITALTLLQIELQRMVKVFQKLLTKTTKYFIKSLSENVILAYFTELSHTHKPSSLWATYSMLKSTLNVNNNVNIHNYPKLVSFLKKQAQGFKSRKSKTLTAEEIKKFLDEAPDNKYLDLKTALIFGICGACRREELTKVTIDNIQDKDNVLLVKIPITKTYKPRSFVISDKFYTICKKYMALRPANIQTSRFFLNYQNGKCTQQPIGINKFGKMPSTIASYLGLSDPSSYTGHTFRRTSATILADSGANILTLKQHGGWKSSTVAEGYIDDSFNNKKKISNQIIVLV